MDLADLTRDLEALREEALTAVEAAPDVAGLDALELDILGKKGRLTGVLRGIGALPAEDRPKVGAIANTVRQAVEAALAERGTALRGSELAARLVAETVDVTTPGRPIRRGTLHPIQETIDEIASIFGQFGFVVYEGPEVEDDVRNFQMLNIPPDHPARDLWDTLYVDVEGHLLRTHTSPGQIRVMHQETPPIRALRWFFAPDTWSLKSCCGIHNPNSFFASTLHVGLASKVKGQNWRWIFHSKSTKARM